MSYESTTKKVPRGKEVCERIFLVEEAAKRPQGAMLRFLPATIFLLLLGIAGCKRVQPIEIPGTWVMNDASRQVLPAGLQQASAKIVLDPKETFIASDMPGLFFFPGRHDARLESGSGTWKLVLSEGRQQVRLEFQQIDDWKKSELPYGTQLDVSKGWSSVNLYYFIGDPDEGRRIEFEKRK